MRLSGHLRITPVAQVLVSRRSAHVSASAPARTGEIAGVRRVAPQHSRRRKSCLTLRSLPRRAPRALQARSRTDPLAARETVLTAFTRLVSDLAAPPPGHAAFSLFNSGRPPI